jgi:hypothetical protein
MHLILYQKTGKGFIVAIYAGHGVYVVLEFNEN